MAQGGFDDGTAKRIWESGLKFNIRDDADSEVGVREFKQRP
jgi:hypothetical protein